ncbi:hypothetical protein [Fulvitalea axinellae]
MMRRLLSRALALVFALGVAGQAVAADDKDKEGFPKTGLSWKLGKNDNQSLSVAIMGQFWLRNIENNPGTINAAGEEESNTWDMAMRRMRLVAKYTYNDRLTVFTQFGTNNVTFNNSIATSSSHTSRPTMFIHDFWGMYKVSSGNQFYLGAGMNAFAGVSRYSNCSSFTFLTLDNPLVNYSGINRHDQFYRQIGMFAAGELGRLNYRIALSKPFTYGKLASELIDGDANNNPYVDNAVAIRSTKFSVKGYAYWQFGDKTSAASPFLPMCYLGSKRIYNLGVGFNLYPESAAYVKEVAPSTLEVEKEDRLEIGVDFMMENPFDNGSSLTYYGVWYHYELGKNYLRQAGIMNVASGQTPDAATKYPQGKGNNYYVIGTGDIFLTEIGYLFPESISLGKTRIQPFGRFTYQDFDAVKEAGTVYDMGVNFLVAGNRFKISAQYSLRPLYEGTVGPDATAEIAEHRGLAIMQLQFRL